jgi:hypothetical protein
MSLILGGWIDPRLLKEVGDLGLSTYLFQLFLPCTERVQRVCVLCALPCTERVQRVCGQSLNPSELMT